MLLIVFQHFIWISGAVSHRWKMLTCSDYISPGPCAPAALLDFSMKLYFWYVYFALASTAPYTRLQRPAHPMHPARPTAPYSALRCSAESYSTICALQRPTHPALPYSALQHPTAPYGSLQHPSAPYNTLRALQCVYTTAPCTPYSALQCSTVPYSIQPYGASIQRPTRPTAPYIPTDFPSDRAPRTPGGREHPNERLKKA